MLTITGIIAIATDPIIKDYDGGKNFWFEAVSPKYYSSGRDHHKSISIRVREKDLNEAYQVLAKEKVIQILFGKLSSYEKEKNGQIYHNEIINIEYSNLKALEGIGKK